MNNARKIVVYAVLAASLAITSFSTGWAQGCPSVVIQTPAGMGIPDEAFEVSASVKNAVGTGDLKYQWTVSSGTIVKGQGSPSISVKATKQDSGTNIEVKVVVDGFSSYCTNTASDKVGIAVLPSCGIGIDFFGSDRPNDVKARVDNVYIQLHNSPGNVALFVMGFSEAESTRERKLRISRILDAIRFRKYDPSRIVFLISSNDESASTRVWIVPEKTYLNDWVSKGTLINGRDMKFKLPTLFQ